MGFDWADYLKLACFIEGQSADFSQEAALRCAVSRAYYASFCHARNYARDNQKFQPRYDARDHHAVREHFRMQRRQRLCSTLNDLKSWREMCDYDDVVANLPTMVREAIQRAGEVIAMLQPTRPASP